MLNTETFLQTQARRRREDLRTVLVTFLVLLAVICSILFAGCGRRATAPVVGPLTIEQFARGVREELIVFLLRAQKNHPECSADKPGAKQGICPAIHSGIDAANRMGAIVNVYCLGAPAAVDDPATPWNETKDYAQGGPCSPVLAIRPQLQAVLSEALLILAQNNQGGTP